VVYGEQRKEVTTSDLGAAVVGVKPDPAADRVVLTARASDGKTGSRSVRPDVDINGNFLVRTDRAANVDVHDELHAAVAAAVGD
jgi:hypothetical protein